MTERDSAPTKRQAWDATAARLRLAREALGLRQIDLARGIGVSEVKQSKYESAGQQMTFDYLWRLEKWYGITASYIITGATAGLPKPLRERLKVDSSS